MTLLISGILQNMRVVKIGWIITTWNIPAMNYVCVNMHNFYAFQTVNIKTVLTSVAQQTFWWGLVKYKLLALMYRKFPLNFSEDSKCYLM